MRSPILPMNLTGVSPHLQRAILSLCWYSGWTAMHTDLCTYIQIHTYPYSQDHPSLANMLMGPTQWAENIEADDYHDDVFGSPSQYANTFRARYSSSESVSFIAASSSAAALVLQRGLESASNILSQVRGASPLPFVHALPTLLLLCMHSHLQCARDQFTRFLLAFVWIPSPCTIL